MNQLEQINNKFQDDMWNQMESFAMRNVSSEQGTFGTAIDILNKRKHLLRAKHPSIYMTPAELEQVQELSQEQPLEVSELAVDPTEPKIEVAPVIEQHDTQAEQEQAPQLEQAYSYNEPQQDLEAPDGHQVVNQVQNTTTAPSSDSGATTDDEPQVYKDKVLSADELMKQEGIEDFGAIFRADKAGQESIESYQAEKTEKHQISVMEAEFANTVDEYRNALPLHNDGSLRDFFHNTRNGESIQIFSSDMQNMTTGEIMDFYKNSDDPIASHRFNQAMDIGYREMLKTHKEERQALYDDPNSTVEDIQKYDKQADLEVGMYEHYLLKYEHGLHASYLNKLEKGPQNQEVAMKIAEAKAVAFEMPTLENLNDKYQVYRAFTPELEHKRDDYSKSIKAEEDSIGQSVPTEVKEVKMELKKDKPELPAVALDPAIEKANRIKARLGNQLQMTNKKALAM